jgi:hypothetical protein
MVSFKELFIPRFNFGLEIYYTVVLEEKLYNSSALVGIF